MKECSLNASDRQARIKLNIFLSACMALLYVLYCFVLVPLTVSLSVNVMYSDTLLPTVAEMVYDAVEILAMCVGYASAVYAIYAFGVRGAVPSMIIFCAVTLFKYVSNIFMDMVNGNLDFETLFYDELWAMILPVALELIQFFVILFIANKVISSHKSGMSKRNKSLEMLGREVPAGDGVYPYSGGLFDRKNPMVRISYWISAVILITSLAQAVPYFLIVWTIEGFDLFQVISYIAVTLFMIVLSYFAVMLIFKLFLSKRYKRQQ